MTSKPGSLDTQFMDVALRLARRGLGQVWPNPAVGCVIVRDGHIVGRGWTQAGGRPHAETEALRAAGSLSRGATAYVTLEPCAHYGKTPPCAMALIDAGIATCFVATLDPDPRVAGKGVEQLRQAGVQVHQGVGEQEARRINAGFLSRLENSRPIVTIKIATSLDGRIATRKGDSQWITNSVSRRFAHRLRAEYDAIAVGSATAIQDDPALTCRLPGMGESSPVRVVFDSRLRLPLTAQLVTTAQEVPSWVYTLEQEAGGNERRQALEGAGVTVIGVAAEETGSLDLELALRDLADRGITRLLVEGGGHLIAAFLRRRLADQLIWMRGPRIIGGDGLPAVRGFGIDRLIESPFLGRTGLVAAGDDMIEMFWLEREED